MNLKRYYVLIHDFDFFGRIIPKGTVYKQLENNDYYRPTIIKENIPSDCPNLDLHFTNMRQEYFIEIYV